MFQTAFTLTLTQFARSLSLPERLQRTPARNLALEALRLRNTTLDALFYDVKAITPDEVFYISDSLAAEGSIMIVPPTGAGSLTLCETLDEFVLRGGDDVHTLAVAGIGGSALGAAAFARNVADAVNGPVAVVVSGYGLADIITEAFGGLFFFGHLKGVRPAFERLDDMAGRTKFGAASAEDDAFASRACLDTQTVRALLADPRLNFKLLAGHSKGNLVLAAALHDLATRDPERAARLAEGMRIVTFGARIAMPPAFSDVTDVIGEWDWFGEMNSRLYIPADRRIRHAWHHTNTDLTGHLPVTNTLKELLAQPPRAEQAEPTVDAPGESAVPETLPLETVEAEVQSFEAPQPEPPAAEAAVTGELQHETLLSEPVSAEEPQAEVQPAEISVVEAPVQEAVTIEAAPVEIAEPAEAPQVATQSAEVVLAETPEAVAVEAAPVEIAEPAESPQVEAQAVEALVADTPKLEAEPAQAEVAEAAEAPQTEAQPFEAPTKEAPKQESLALESLPTPAPPKPAPEAAAAARPKTAVSEKALPKTSAAPARRGRPRQPKRH
jgi:hypothetical protein